MITFRTRAYADIPMLGDVARKMLGMMDFGTEIPGAILAKDVPTARDNLKRALDRVSEVESDGDDETDQPTVSINTRAFPLLELLDAAITDEEIVSWD